MCHLVLVICGYLRVPVYVEILRVLNTVIQLVRIYVLPLILYPVESIEGCNEIEAARL